MKKQDFFVTFLLLMAFRFGGVKVLPPAPPPWHCVLMALPTGYAYDCTFNAICDIKILCAFLQFAFVCMSKRH